MGLTTYDDEFLLAAIVIISMALIFYSVGYGVNVYRGV